MFAPPVKRGPAQLLTALVLALVPTATAQAQLPVPLPVPTAPAPSTTAPAPTTTPASAVAGCAGADALPGSVSAATVRSAMLCLLNVQRAAHGLPALRASRPLRAAATRWARTMVSRHFFDHARSGSTLSTRVARTAYLRRTRSWALGENIAYGSGARGTPAAIVAAWMGSPPHRANILLRRFRDIGIGVAPGVPVGGSGATFVTDFGVRR